MKVNRILWSKLKMKHDILKMVAAYIRAEQEIIANSSTGMADDMETVVGWSFETDHTGNTYRQDHTVRDLQIKKLEEQIAEMEEQGRKLLEAENYELMRELKEIYDLAVKQLNNLKK